MNSSQIKGFQNSHIRAALTVLVTFFLISSGPSPAWGAAGKTILRIHGSNTIGAKLMPDLAKRFLKKKGYQFITQDEGARKHEYFIVGIKGDDIHRIEINAHGSSTGFKSLEDGGCDIAMASRRIKNKEIQSLEPLGDMTAIDNEHILAIDGIAVIVNPSNNRSELDKIQLKKIFSGKITNWKQVGGKDTPIKVYARNDRSGTYDTFKTMVLNKTRLIGTAKRYASNEDLSYDVFKDPGAIGFVSMPGVLNSKALTIKEEAGSAGVRANHITVACEDYPLSRRLYLYTASMENRWVKEFIGFALSNEGQNRVSMLGFSKLSMDMDGFEVNTSRFRDKEQNLRYKNETLGGRRVNFNFCFTPSGGLENRSKKDLDRLIQYIQHPDQKYYELVLIGINGCKKTNGVGNLILKRIGTDRFYVPPRIICLDDVFTPGGTPWKPVIEVWLRTVDDGA